MTLLYKYWGLKLQFSARHTSINNGVCLYHKVLPQLSQFQAKVGGTYDFVLQILGSGDSNCSSPLDTLAFVMEQVQTIRSCCSLQIFPSKVGDTNDFMIYILGSGDSNPCSLLDTPAFIVEQIQTARSWYSQVTTWISNFKVQSCSSHIKKLSF